MFRTVPMALPWMTAVLDAAGDGILIEQGERVLYANQAYARLLHYRRPAEILHQPVAALIAADDVDRLLRFGRLRAAGQHPPSAYDFAARCVDAASVRLQASVSMAIYSGQTYIMSIVRPFHRSEQAAPEAEIPGPHDLLSARERVIMEQLLAGKRPKNIALDLGISEKTVATHRGRLIAKIGVTDNCQLFQYGLRHGLIHWT
jgi:PAS domain S-box-containing protein